MTSLSTPEALDSARLVDDASAENLITIGDYLLTRLSEIGVRHMFGVPGDFNLWFLERAIKGKQVEFIGCCNELNAAYAADGCSRLAGCSALIVTYGVGELASLSGIAGAYAERVPVVCINGTPPLHSMQERAFLHHTLADGNFNNMLVCYREFTVAQARIEPLHAREEIDRVLRTCVLEKRPVYLQLPSDVAGVRVPAITKPLDIDPPPSDPVQLSQVLSMISERLSQAQNPAFLLDVDADRFGLTELIVKLADVNDIPLTYLIAAKGIIPDAHPLLVGMYRGAGSSARVKEVVEGSDCLICVGTRFTDLSSGWFSHTLNEASVVDVQPFSVKVGGKTLSAIQSKELFIHLLEASPYRTANPSIRSEYRPSPPAPFRADRSLTQLAFWQHISSYLEPGDVITAEAGTSYFSSVNLFLPENVAFLGQPIWGSIGYTLPAVLGAALADNTRRQLLFIGDGAFQMTAQELSTILRLDLKPIIFLINNDGYTIERLIFGADSIYNDISPWRYRQLPSVFDRADRAAIHLVRTEGELEVALDAAREADRLNFIEVVLPRMDAPEQLVRLAKHAAGFDFPQIHDEAN
jgi:indolepyruvate decarboxylase